MQILCPKCKSLLLEDKEEIYVNGNIICTPYLICINESCKASYHVEINLYPRIKDIEIKLSFKIKE
jgi:hypothetical protein